VGVVKWTYVGTVCIGVWTFGGTVCIGEWKY